VRKRTEIAVGGGEGGSRSLPHRRRLEINSYTKRFPRNVDSHCVRALKKKRGGGGGGRAGATTAAALSRKLVDDLPAVVRRIR
jgi:hypothetical protein